ncbi:MAG: sugar phosphate isomerase/epimerase [Clostridia bacterium]|nr:sugar phosphate isomerase/epimerase [Clostridia bacterium]
MKIGACGSIFKAPAIKEAGFDFLETAFWKFGNTMTDEEFSSQAKEFEKIGLPVQSYNCFFPNGMKIYEDGAFEEIRKHLETAFPRTASIGGKIAVIGSGAARRVPEGMDKALADKKFLDILSLSAEIADKYSMKVVIEPLNFDETNFINTVGQGADFARKCGKENVGVLVDFFHFELVNEEKDALNAVSDVLLHAHLSNRTANECRRVPTADDIDALKEWAGMLKAADYKGDVAIECDFTEDYRADLKIAKEMMELFKTF